MLVSCEVNGDCRVWINGNESSSGTLNVGTAAFTLGAISEASEYFRGILSHLALWLSPASSGERTALMAHDPEPDGEGDITAAKAAPFCWFKFNEGFDGEFGEVTLIDSGSGGHDTVLTGAVANTNKFNLINADADEFPFE